MNMLFKLMLLFILFPLVACKDNSSLNSNNASLPPQIPIQHTMLEMLETLINTDSPDLYFPSESKIADTDVNSPEEAFRQLTKLYPNKSQNVGCWAELNKHFVFSLRQSNEKQCSYLYILYVPIGGRKFGYYWPHT